MNVAIGGAMNVAISVAMNVAISVAMNVAISVAMNVAISVAMNVAISVAMNVAISVAMNVAISVAMNVAISVAMNVAISVAMNVAISVAMNVAISVARRKKTTLCIVISGSACFLYIYIYMYWFDPLFKMSDAKTTLKMVYISSKSHFGGFLASKGLHACLESFAKVKKTAAKKNPLMNEKKTLEIHLQGSCLVCSPVFLLSYSTSIHKSKIKKIVPEDYMFQCIAATNLFLDYGKEAWVAVVVNDATKLSLLLFCSWNQVKTWNCIICETIVPHCGVLALILHQNICCLVGEFSCATVLGGSCGRPCMGTVNNSKC